MFYKKADISRDFLMNADMMNSLNGGRSLPTIDIQKETDHYKLSIDIPGIQLDNLRVEINNNRLAVYYIMQPENSLATEEDTLPYLIAVNKIPREVQIEHISAYYENDLLEIIMPYNELANGYHKNVDIHHQ